MCLSNSVEYDKKTIIKKKNIDIKSSRYVSGIFPVFWPLQYFYLKFSKGHKSHTVVANSNRIKLHTDYSRTGHRCSNSYGSSEQKTILFCVWRYPQKAFSYATLNDSNIFICLIIRFWSLKWILTACLDFQSAWNVTIILNLYREISNKDNVKQLETTTEPCK